MSNTAKEPITSPVGIAKYPKLAHPDDKGEYADGKYKVELVLDVDAAAEFETQMRAVASRLAPDLKNPRLPIRSKNGEHSVIFKSQHKPRIVDSSLRPLPDDYVLRGGAKIRVSATAAAYKTGINEGITLYLNAVQLIEASGSSSSYGVSAFSPVAGGYVHQGVDDPFGAP